MVGDAITRTIELSARDKSVMAFTPLRFESPRVKKKEQTYRKGEQGMKDNTKGTAIRDKTRLSLLLVVLVFILPGSNQAIFADDFGSLLGRWQRVDGGYVIEVRQIQADGQMDAGYFNPRPINVARAQASVHGDKIKIEVELRDRGYPGSAYTLIYAADRDALVGYYYQPRSDLLTRQWQF